MRHLFNDYKVIPSTVCEGKTCRIVVGKFIYLKDEFDRQSARLLGIKEVTDETLTVGFWPNSEVEAARNMVQRITNLSFLLRGHK